MIFRSKCGFLGFSVTLSLIAIILYIELIFSGLFAIANLLTPLYMYDWNA
jgi:preprotein translocase subunit SecF